MNEPASDVIVARARAHDTLMPTLAWSVAAHALVVAAIWLAPDTTANRTPRTVMTINLGGAEGPRAGFFPFYIGLFIIVSSAINFWHVLRDGDGELFAEWTQLRQVMSVVIPTAIYVGAMPFTGLYLASIIFIGYFMRWLGKYRWVTVLAVALGMPIVTYFIFERYFMVPLPKGPIEDWLGI